MTAAADGRAGSGEQGATSAVGADGQDVGGPVARVIEASDREATIDLMRRTRAHFAGARHDAIYAAIVDDSLCSPPRMMTVVAELDGDIVGFNSTIISESRAYWRTLPLRHPAAAAAIARHRLKKLGRRISYRRRNRALYESDEVLVPAVELPPEVAERLQQRPPATGSPRPGEHGPGYAFCLFVGVDPAVRGRRIPAQMFDRIFDELRAVGAQRYDCSFSSKDPAAIRMHLKYPFTVYRLPGGYWASLRLADLDR